MSSTEVVDLRARRLQREGHGEKRALAGLLRLNQIASKTRDLDELLMHSLDVLEDVLEPNRAAVLLISAEKRMEFRAWRRLSDGYRVAVEGHSPWKLDDPAPSPVLVPDVFADAELAGYREVFAREGIGALAFVPLACAGKLLGKFMLYYDAPHTFSEEELELAQAIASHIAFVVARMQAEKQLALYRHIFAHSTEPTAIIDRRGRYVEQNPAHAALTGYSDSELEGRTPAIHLGEEGFERVRRELVRSGRCELDVVSRPRGGGSIEAELRAFTLRDDAGAPLYFVGVKRDVTASRRAERRLRLLAAAGEILSASGEAAAVLHRIARVAVTTLADLCVIDRVDEHGVMQRLAAASSDPQHEEVLETLRTHYAPLADSNQPSAQAMRSAAPVLFAEVTEASLRGMCRNDAHFEAASALGLKSLVAVPLHTGDRVLGAITLAWAGANRSYDGDDVACAQELAARVSIALENARLNRELNEAVRARDEFLSIGSHELKTPLTSLQLQLERVMRDAPTYSQSAQGALNSASRQVRRLTKLVNELLEVSRLSAGKLTLERETFDLAGLAREVSQRFEPELARAGSTLTFDAEETVVGSWDRLRIDLALSNLLSNACKYGAGRPVQVRVRAVGARVRIEVEDRGIGIAPEHLPRVFGRFERMVSTRHFGGFGLGLWITRSVVEAHGGNIRVSSVLGQGSTFTIELPLSP